MLKDVFENAKSAFVIAIGGGGDVAGASITYYLALKEGMSAYIGAVMWERFSVDVVPGPIKIEDLRSARPLGHYVAVVDESTYAERGGRKVVPQIVNAVSIIGCDGFGISIDGPIDAIAEELAEIVDKFGIDVVIGIDVGGDVLAEGHEDTLRSPLADAYTTAVLYKLKKLTGVPVAIGIAGPGVDGELERSYIYERMSALARKGAYLCAYGPTKGALAFLGEVLQRVVTEASRAIYEAARGFHGVMKLRGGSRTTHIDISSSITYLFDLEKSIDELPLVKLLLNAQGIRHGMEILNSYGILTELNIEEELYRLYTETGRTPESEEVSSIIERLRREIRKKAGAQSR